MTYYDFVSIFDKIDICHMLRSPKEAEWKGRQTYGTLRKPNRFGGCINNDSFSDNPQVLNNYFKLT